MPRLLAAGLISGLALGCARADLSNENEPILTILDVRVQDAPLRVGQGGVQVFVDLQNTSSNSGFVVDAEVISMPEGALELWPVVEELPTVEANGTATARLIGRVSPLASKGLVSLVPTVRAVETATGKLSRARLGNGPWTVEIVGGGASLIVNTTVDEMDGPAGMTDPAQAGATLSLREAMTLVNNGLSIRRITFEPAVFPIDPGATIRVGAGPAGNTGLPAITVDGWSIDGQGAGVTISSYPALDPGEPLLPVTGAGVEIRDVSFGATYVALEVFAAPSLEHRSG